MVHWNNFRSFLILMVLLSFTMSSACARAKDSQNEGRSGRLIVVATLFPLYDFAKNIAGDRADVKLLLPPGAEPHSFEPKPADIVMLNRADIFIYTNKIMEPWAEDMLKGLQGNRLSVVDASSGVRFIEGSTDGAEGGNQHQRSKPGQKEEHDQHEAHGADPHIWLDFSNAQKMVDNIAGAFIAKDPSNSDLYTRNAEAYKARLEGLDKAYQKGLSNCRKKIFVNGGHYTFGYLANRYGLQYRAAYGFSPDAEPTARNLADISKTLRREGLDHLFFEELLSPRIAETIAKETGAALLKLHGAHNISKEEFNANRTFIELMEKNLDNLMIGLQCR
ncbi:MAG: metal ABC transporter substrate-binding protein [Nitrospirota bacterium]|nr:metal ABC transporter substrate-binding protein [Nitrospirota bacterium]